MLLAMLASDVPSSPPLERWLLEIPWPAAAVCLSAGLLALYMCNQRGMLKRGAALLAIGAALAAGVIAAASLIVTDAERVSEQTSDIILSTFEGDAARAGALIAPQLLVASAGDELPSFGRQEFLQIVGGFRNFRATGSSHRIRGAGLDAPNVARTRAMVWFDAPATGEIPSTWEFTWRKNTDGRWLLVRLDCQTLWGQPPRADWASRATQISLGRSPGF